MNTALASYAVNVFLLLPHWLNNFFCDMSENNKLMWEQVVNTVVYGFHKDVPPNDVAETIKAYFAK